MGLLKAVSTAIPAAAPTAILWTDAKAFDYAEEKKLEVPEREVSIIVTQEGYYPKTLIGWEGERVHMYLTSTLPTPTCLTMPDQNLFLAASRGQIYEGFAYFPKAGTYKFNCPNGKISGEFRILEKGQKKTSRSVASTKVKEKPWRPTELPESIYKMKETEKETVSDEEGENADQQAANAASATRSP